MQLASSPSIEKKQQVTSAKNFAQISVFWTRNRGRNRVAVESSPNSSWAQYFLSKISLKITFKEICLKLCEIELDSSLSLKLSFQNCAKETNFKEIYL